MFLGRFKVYVYALLSMLFWGVSFVWFKIIFEHGYQPISIIFFRLVLSSIILYVVVKFLKVRQKISRSDYGRFLLLALFQPFLYFMGESFGLSMVSSTIASVIIATIPVFTPIFAFLFLRENISALNIVGLMVSFIGILFMVLDSNFSFNASTLGIMLLFCAVISAIFYGITVKKLSSRYNPITIIQAQNLIGAFYFLPLFLIIDYSQFITVVPDYRVIGALVQLALFASTLAFVLYIPVVNQLGISKANIFTNFIPVFTAVFSYFLLSETFNAYKIIGVIIVIAGALIAQLKQIICYRKTV